jgi:hypothetical protein
MPAVNASNAVDSLASFRSEIDAIPDAQVLTPRVDVSGAALIAIGSMPEIEAHRARIVSFFGDAGGLTLDRLAPVAHELMLAQAALTAITDRDLEPMARDLMDVRTRLFTAGLALIERGVVSKKSFDRLTGGQSYLGRVEDTMALVVWFRAQTSAVLAQTKVDVAELARAHSMAEEFAEALGERNQALAGTSKAARDRARMFTLFFRTYERVRKMLTYLRWHEGDVDKIAPSIFAGRSSRKQDDEDVVTEGADRVLTTTVVSPGLPGADPFDPT